MRKTLLNSVLSLIGYGLGAMAVVVLDLNISFGESLCWAVAAVAVPLALIVPRETWCVIERVYSEKVEQLLNIFGYRSRSTGSLCSPLLA